MIRRWAMRFLCSSFSKEPYMQSKYYKPREPVEKFLNRTNIMYRASPNSIKIRECPFCPKPHNNDPTNLFTLNVHKQTGVYHCFRCSNSGSYLDLKGRILGIDDGNHRSVYSNADLMGSSNQADTSANRSNQSSYSSTQPPKVLTQTQYFVRHQQLHLNQYRSVKEYLIIERGLDQKTLDAYKIGAGEERFTNEMGQWVDVKVIYFPMFSGVPEKERIKYRTDMMNYIIQNGVDEEKAKLLSIDTEMARVVKCKIRGASSDTKQYMRQYPSGPLSGFFGYNLVKQDTKEVVITEGEFDAMSVYQQTGKVALSLPQGASFLPDQLVPMLDQFEKIYLWMDNDKAGEINAPKIASKIGIKRTFIVNNTEKKLKDANDILRNKPEQMKNILSQAATIPGKNILSFEDLKSKIRFNILNAQKLRGVPSKAFNFFNKKLKGFRTGELTIISGGTGSGKTTLLSQLSVDFCQQGVGTLWGSFEIKNQVLAYTMLSQQSKVNFHQHKQKFDFHADKFGQLPLYWLSFHGSTDLDKVFGTIQYAIQKYDVSHVIIDTLQFLLSDQAEGFRKFDLQDSTMSRLRRIATDQNVHVTVVIHPKKVPDGDDLGLDSIFGSGKSVQEADNVLMIQQRQNFKVLQVKKNRFDGETGKTGIGFDKGIKSFFELTREELELLQKNQIKMSEVVAQRAIQTKNKDHQQILSTVNPKSSDYSGYLSNRSGYRK